MSFKDTLFSVKQTINCGGILLDFKVPRIMGILNVTPDSFYDGGFYNTEDDIVAHAGQMISEGADIIDIGAYSSRPGAPEVSESEEKERLKRSLSVIRRNFPSVLISVDTFRSEIARYAVLEYGVNMINDISAGKLDEKMFSTAGSLKVPYILMHMLGTPATMQLKPVYNDVVKDLLAFFSDRIAEARNEGIEDIIVDPGFGFGKTPSDNFRLLRELKLFGLLGFPVMAGLSRKSMIYRSLGVPPAEALNGTVVLQTLALNNDASLLRVHDVKEAVQAVKLVSLYKNTVS